MQPSGIEASDAATEVMNEERASAAQLEDSGERPSSASSSASGSDSGSETVAEVTGARWMRAPPAPADDVPLTRRYEPRELLGEGGMGEVHRCTDARIGREVAMKVMRHADEPGSSTKRFRREALLQANLEHPSIVPVYDVGVDAEGAPCFAMKRVRGQTLRHILTRIAEGDELARRRYPVHKLLGAFSQVCLAIDFAHSRGVIHRDLKPANIMLGDFGEVYVLDWGLASTAGAPDSEDGLPLVPRIGDFLKKSHPCT
jgi:serine/threonine-protein kinase